MTERDLEYEQQLFEEDLEHAKTTCDGGRSRYSKVCNFCRHLYCSSAHTCAAYPRGIPDEIFDGRNLHSEPYPGDHGLQFEFDLRPFEAPPDKPVRNEMRALLTAVAAPLGFSYDPATCNFLRPRGELLDVLFFVPYRRSSCFVGLGVDAPALRPRLDGPVDERPGLCLVFKWLAGQRLYAVLEDDSAWHDPAIELWEPDSIHDDFHQDALSWFARYSSVADVERDCKALRQA